MNHARHIDNPLFFIVGRGRSGTTLLSSMLNMHPGISIAPEGIFVMNLRRKYAKAKWTRKSLLSFCDDLWLERRLDGWNIQKELLRSELLSLDTREVSFPALCKAVYRHHAVLSGKDPAVLLGDKNPHYSLFVGELIGLFPASKFIYVARDYRDNILSYKNVRFDLKNTAALAYRWAAYNKSVLSQQQSFPEKFILVRYEDLIADPVTGLQRLCAFLNVRYLPEMLEFHRDRGRSVRQWHSNLRKPLQRDNTDKWKDRLSSSDVRQADYICSSTGLALGYAPHGRSRSVLPPFSVIGGYVAGRFVTVLEKLLFYLPLSVRSKMISGYRILTGSLHRRRSQRPGG